MPKSGRGRSKYSKNAKARRSVPAATSQQAATPGAQTAPLRKPSPVVAASGVKIKSALPTYDYIRSELRRIGILAGIMIIVLIILAVALP